MQALGMIRKSSHDVLDILSTRYDRIMSEMFSVIVDFCLYMFAAML